MSPRLPFIDWMKALGMFIIVFGHIVGGPIRFAMPPILPKQIGVVLFLFILGFSLARETRPRGQVAFNRTFDILLLGLIFAVSTSITQFLFTGRLALSNYLPFLLGVNVLLDDFPANPTTWYIGTYLHFILLWMFVLQNVQVRPWMLGFSLVVEIGLRALLMHRMGPTEAYMMLPNWMTVFLLGMFLSQRTLQDGSPVTLPASKGLLGWGTALAGMIVLWPLFFNQFSASSDFPFRAFESDSLVVSLLVTSTAISVLYVVYARLIYEVTRRLPDLAVVRFFAANTLIVFFAHMVLWNQLTYQIQAWIPDPRIRHPLNVLIFFVGLSLVSEWIMRWFPLKQIRNQVGESYFHWSRYVQQRGWGLRHFRSYIQHYRSTVRPLDSSPITRTVRNRLPEEHDTSRPGLEPTETTR